MDGVAPTAGPCLTVEQLLYWSDSIWTGRAAQIDAKTKSEILESDELHLVSLLLKDVRLQMKYNGVIGNIFTPDIGSPQGDCASPI